jgi:hypothetical protein
MKAIFITAGFTTFAALGLLGCASISQDQCLTGNWAERGYNDGLSGKSRNKLSSYAETCGKYSVLPDSEAYLNAYEEGLIGYCTYERGFSRGERGDSYNSVCTGELAHDFRPGYDEGRIVYKIHKTHENLIERFEDTRNAIRDVRFRLDNDEMSDDERRRLEKKLRRLRERKEELRRDIRSHERRYDLRGYRFGR